MAKRTVGTIGDLWIVAPTINEPPLNDEAEVFTEDEADREAERRNREQPLRDGRWEPQPLWSAIECYAQETLSFAYSEG